MLNFKGNIQTLIASKVQDFFLDVCLDVMKPPMVFATCLKYFIVSKDCIRHWIPDTPTHCIKVTRYNTKLNKLMTCCIYSVKNRLTFY